MDKWSTYMYIFAISDFMAIFFLFSLQWTQIISVSIEDYKKQGKSKVKVNEHLG